MKHDPSAWTFGAYGRRALDSDAQAGVSLYQGKGAARPATGRDHDMPTTDTRNARTARVIQYNRGGWKHYEGTAEVDDAAGTISMGTIPTGTLTPTDETNSPEGWPLYTCEKYVGTLAVEPAPAPARTFYLTPSPLFGAWDVDHADTGRNLGTIRERLGQWEAKRNGTATLHPTFGDAVRHLEANA